MTAGMTTRSMEGSRISLPRAGLGALLAGTLLAGSLLGAAAYAGITATSTSGTLAAELVAPPRVESAGVRHARIEAGNGPLAGDTGGTQAAVTAGQAATRAIPYRGDGFGGDGFGLTAGEGRAPTTPYRGDGFAGDGFDVSQPNGQPPAVTITHASGHGPLR